MFAVYWTNKEGSQKSSQVFETRQKAEEKAAELKEKGHLFIDIKENVEPQNYLEK
jgi:uncharacterized protein YfcZ (UPF0381/DUF406 family)